MQNIITRSNALSVYCVYPYIMTNLLYTTGIYIILARPKKYSHSVYHNTVTVSCNIMTEQGFIHRRGDIPGDTLGYPHC